MIDFEEDLMADEDDYCEREDVLYCTECGERLEEPNGDCPVGCVSEHASIDFCPYHGKALIQFVCPVQDCSFDDVDDEY